MMLRIGMLLHGFCNGYFSHGSYGPKRVESFGIDWIVVREEDGQPDFAFFTSAKQMEELLVEWTQDESLD